MKQMFIFHSQQSWTMQMERRRQRVEYILYLHIMSCEVYFFLLTLSPLYYVLYVFRDESRSQRSSLEAWCPQTAPPLPPAVSVHCLSPRLTSDRTDPGKINVVDFKCVCLLLSCGNKGHSIMAISPPSPTTANLQIYTIKGCHSKSLETPVSSRLL